MSTLVQGPVIDVRVQVNQDNTVVFTYFRNGELTSGNVMVTCGESIRYQLINSEGFSFVGAGFVTPFDGIVNAIQVSNDGQQLVLIDQDLAKGSTEFQLILRNDRNSLLLLSPDPQVVNKDNPPL